MKIILIMVGVLSCFLVAMKNQTAEYLFVNFTKINKQIVHFQNSSRNGDLELRKELSKLIMSREFYRKKFLISANHIRRMKERG